MDAQQFLAEFGHIANAPEGVARLRELVLYLAVSGALIRVETPIDASPLLEAIEFQKQRHPDRKKVIAKQQPVYPDALGAPPHWAACRLGDIALTITGGGTPSKSHPGYWGGDIPWASVKDLKDYKYLDRTDEQITEEGLKNSSSNLIPPGRVIVCTRMGLGKIAINRVAMAINQDLKALELPAQVHPDFFLILYKTLELKGTGTTVAGIKQDQLLAMPAALPPFEEQSCIVVKVDELMALCDQLEVQLQGRRQLQNDLRQSTLKAVASAPSSHELQESWQRLQANFGCLFSQPEDVADLRQTILDLAFTGNISEQSEQVTSALVESLHLRKMQLSAEKRIKRETPVIDFPGIAEMLGDIPDQWSWVRLNDIASVVRGGSPRPAGDSRYYGGSIPFLKVADVTATKGMFVEKFTATITEAGLKKTREISTRTVLLTNSGATLGVPAICEFKTTFNDGIAAFVELSDAVFDEYLYLFLKSKTKWIQDIASRGQGQPNLNTEIIRSMWFPLASLSEQHRIVARVSELMGICDVLEASVKQGSAVSERLATASVSSLTGITIQQNEEAPVKAPQTELIALLRLGISPDVKAPAPLATILARHHGELPARDLWQRFGGEIDAFYMQLKTEVAHGWITEPAVAEMREKAAATGN